jgi:transposase
MPMQLWFYAIFVFVTTRHGVSARELKRSLGVTLKTAWRMVHKNPRNDRTSDMGVMLDGHVEIDETLSAARPIARTLSNRKRL